MDAKTKRTVIAVVLGTLVVLFMMAVVLVGSAIFYVRRHIQSQYVTSAIGIEQFEHERARFQGQQPLLEWRDHDRPIVHERVAASSAPLEGVHIVAFDPRAGRVVRVNIPFWLLRLTPGRRFNIGSNTPGFDFDSDRMHVTVDDLERAGPGLLLDITDPPSGARVLAWTE